MYYYYNRYTRRVKSFLCFTLRCKSRQLHFVASQLSPSCNGLLVKSISSKDAYSEWSSVSRCHCMQIQVNNRRTEQLCRRCSQTGDFTSGHISNFCSLTSRKVISWRFISPTRNVAWCGRKVKDTCRTATESAHPHLRISNPLIHTSRRAPPTPTPSHLTTSSSNSSPWRRSWRHRRPFYEMATMKMATFSARWRKSARRSAVVHSARLLQGT